MQATSYKLQANEEGTAIYIAIFTLSAIMATALAVSTIAVGEYRISRETTDSMQAVYVADSAMEYSMFEIRKNAEASILDNTSTATLDQVGCSNQIHFADFSSADSLGCKANIYNDVVADNTYSNCKSTLPLGIDCTRIISIGSFGGTNRAMEIVFPNL